MDRMDGTNFSVEGLDDLIEAVKEKVEKKAQAQTNEEKMKQFEEIINGVARKYFSYGKQGNKYLSQEDAVQELWVRILELIRDCGGVEYTDASLVARIAYNKAVDLFRFHQRRYDSKAEFFEGTEYEFDYADIKFDRAPNYFEALWSDKFIKGYDLVLYKEVIDLFEIGSKERKYVVLKLINSGLLKKSDLDPWDQAIVAIPETEDEEGYIHELGYKSHCPGSWTCKKRAMYTTIVEFLK